MKVAAVQMTARPADVSANLETAGRLAEDAFKAGAEMVILPEFFPSAVNFHPDFIRVNRPADGEPFRLLRDLAKKHGGLAGGSFIADSGADAVNRFVLAHPDGSFGFHDKDLPTMWENCYYVGGSKNDDGVLETPVGPVGAAMCWEFVRTQTAKRLKGRVGMVVGGSCWWGLPEKLLPGFPRSLDDEMLEIMKDTPARMARMLGVPVVHAAHAGHFSGRMPLVPGFPFKSHMLGETSVIDADGKILARMSWQDGEGFVTAEISPKVSPGGREPIPEGFWIPRLPWQIRLAWAYQNFHGKWYYRLRTRPQRQKAG